MWGPPALAGASLPDAAVAPPEDARSAAYVRVEDAWAPWKSFDASEACLGEGLGLSDGGAAAVRDAAAEPNTGQKPHGNLLM